MRTTQRSRVHIGLALCVLVTATACGSTVADRATTTGGLAQGGAGSGTAPADGGLGGAAAPGPAAGRATGAAGGTADGSSGTAGASGTTGAAGSTSGGTAGVAGGAAGGTSPQTAQGSVGPGITPTTVYLGAPYFPDAASGNAALGASGANSGDQRDYYKAVIDDLNRRGGILGRKVVPIYFPYKAQSTEPVDSQSESACNQWTKDNKVFAILYSGRVLEECARKAGTLITGGVGETGPVFDKLPNLIDATAVRLERLGAATVSGVSKQGYFGSSPEWPTGKVGVITWEDPAYRYGVTNGYVPALKRLGKTAKVIYVAKAQTLSGASDSSAAVSNAVLQFRSDGIDHVFIQDGPAGVFGLGGLTLLFLQNAKSQRYYPRYGFNANNVPGYSIYPADQEHGMLAVDYSDYQPEQDAGITANPARTRCFALMAKAGLKTNDINTQATAAGICNDVWLVETLLKSARTPTLQGAIAAAEGLGTTFRSPVVYGTRLGPGRHDGGELARAAKFDDGCSCMRFTSAPYAP